MNEHIAEKLKILPDDPGCYLMLDQTGVIIYVGKAKVLKNRVRSYFFGAHDMKTMNLVREIVDFTYIITSSDFEALLLEMNLIQEHQPKYNIRLKDDKSYPFLKITRESHPRLIMTRTVKKDGGKYFGPYPQVKAARETLNLLERIFPFRKCHPLKNKFCLYYHIDQCLGPCELKITDDTYNDMVKNVTQFLKGDVNILKKDIVQKMEQAAEIMNFELAKEYRDQIIAIDTMMEKQQVRLNDAKNRDVFGYYYKDGWMSVQVFFMRQGKLIERQASIFFIYNTPEEEMLTFIGLFYSQGNNIKPEEIIIPEVIDAHILEELVGIKILVPRRGGKNNLLKLAIKNAEVALDNKFLLEERKLSRTTKAIENIGEMLGISEPRRIESFDNSTIQGVDSVSALVVFTDGKPDKKEYRKFKIKTAAKNDDYGAMQEVVRRRYLRLLDTKSKLPDLVIVDGGKGHIEAAKEVLRDELNLDIPVAGLVKDDKHRTSELLYGDPPVEINFPRSSQEFYLLQRIQDEVHRFAITFHRNTRRKSSLVSILDEVTGIGPKRKKQLLNHFGSIDKIKNAPDDELKKLGIPEKTISELKIKLKK